MDERIGNKIVNGGDNFNMFSIGKFSLIITTRCNLKCKLCCEYVPQNRPFPDMQPEEAHKILEATFDVIDHITTVHLTGGGEPFLQPKLPELIEVTMEYVDKFDRLMLFTNSTVPISDKLLKTLERYKEKILVQLSLYNIFPEREKITLEKLQSIGVNCKVVDYGGENPAFGGWVDFGSWEAQNKSDEELTTRFHNCAVTRDMHGNWRTRDGKLHWCSRSQRGLELKLLPDYPDDYVDLFDKSESKEFKREKLQTIANKNFLSACRHCSGDQGTSDITKRFKAAEQI